MKNIRDSYKWYKEMSDNPVPIKDYVRIINNFNKHIINLVLDGKEVRLPQRMGAISVKGKKVKLEFDEDGRIKGQAPDYKATNELWERCPECKEKKQLVFHLNEHTSGIRYKYFWSKEGILVANKTFYTMVFTRTNKRTLAKLINQGKEYYVEPEKYY